MSDFSAFERLALPIVRGLVALWVRPSVLPDDAKARLGAGRAPVYALEKRSVDRPRGARVRLPRAGLAGSARCRSAPRRVLPDSLIFLERRTGFFGQRIDRRMPEALRALTAAAGEDITFDADLDAGEPVLGPRAGSRALVVPAADRRGLGHRRPLPQVPLAAHQRPQPAGAVRRGACRCSRRCRRRGACRAARAGCGASCACSSATSARRRSVPTSRTGARSWPRCCARRPCAMPCAQDMQDKKRRPPRRAQGRARLRVRDRGQLLARVRRVHVGRARPALEPALRRRRTRQFREPAVRRRGQRDRLRAVPPQPHGLPAAVVRRVPQGLRGAAHRGRHQPQHAGDRLVPAARRRVLPAPQFRRQRDLLGRVHALPRRDDGARPLDRVLHRRRPQPHRAPAAAEDRHARDDGAQPTCASRCARSCSCRSISATSAWSKAAPTSASCPDGRRRRNRSSACCGRCPNCAAASARSTSASASRCRSTALLERHVPGWDRQQPVTDEKPAWLSPLCVDLAHQIMTRINAAACVTPVNLIGHGAARDAAAAHGRGRPGAAARAVCVADAAGAVLAARLGHAARWPVDDPALRVAAHAVPAVAPARRHRRHDRIDGGAVELLSATTSCTCC